MSRIPIQIMVYNKYPHISLFKCIQSIRQKNRAYKHTVINEQKVNTVSKVLLAIARIAIQSLAEDRAETIPVFS